MFRLHPTISVVMVFLLTVQTITGCMTHQVVRKADHPDEYRMIQGHPQVRVVYENEEGEPTQITGRLQEVTDVSITVNWQAVDLNRVLRVEIIGRATQCHTLGRGGYRYSRTWLSDIGVVCFNSVGLRGGFLMTRKPHNALPQGHSYLSV